MKKNIIKIIVVVLILLIIAGMYMLKNNVFDTNTDNTNVSDVDIYEESNEVSNIESLPTVKHFVLNNCYYCEAMEPTIEKLTTEFKDKVNIVVINANENYSEAKKYNISQTPTQLFFDKDGKLITRIVGYMTEEEILDVLEQKLGVSK